MMPSTPNDFSLLSLLLNAHWTVQTVMVILLVLSCWSWTVIIGKTLQFRRLEEARKTFEEEFWASSTMIDLARKHGENPTSPAAALFVAAMNEWGRMSQGLRHQQISVDRVQERIERLVDTTLLRRHVALEEGIAVLAGISSSSPFIGLFGTVLGIMSAFTSIATNTTQATLTAVAPGIAEALFATAMGLFTAIPAAWAYNTLSNTLRTHIDKVGLFSSDFLAIFIRQLHELHDGQSLKPEGFSGELSSSSPRSPLSPPRETNRAPTA